MPCRNKKCVRFAAVVKLYIFHERNDWDVYRKTDINSRIMDRQRFLDRIEQTEHLLEPLLRGIVQKINAEKL